MLLSHVDESYTADHYYMAALLTPDSEALPLARALEEVGGEGSVRLPSRALGGVAWAGAVPGVRRLGSDGHMTRARIGVFNAAFEALARHNVAIIIRGVDIRRQVSRYANPRPPYVVTLEHLLERIHDHTRDRDEYSLVIAGPKAVGSDGAVAQRPLGMITTVYIESLRPALGSVQTGVGFLVLWASRFSPPGLPACDGCGSVSYDLGRYHPAPSRAGFLFAYIDRSASLGSWLRHLTARPVWRRSRCGSWRLQ
ncbi:MAG TPA: hypothetical protein VFZ32_11955 [Micromonosporaceae bacterium]